MFRLPTAASTAKAGTILIALGAFWLSFTALRDLAERSGVPTGQSWVWPLIVDGLVVVATVAVVALDEHRWYAWSLLATGASISLVGNSLHATYMGELPVSVRILVAAVAPLSLLASTHLTYLLAHNPQPTNPKPRSTVEPLVTMTRTPVSEESDLGAQFRRERQGLRAS